MVGRWKDSEKVLIVARFQYGMCNMEQMWNYSNYFLRYLVASRDIQPGTTILLDKPLAVGPHAGGALQCISCGFGVLIALNYVYKL